MQMQPPHQADDDSPVRPLIEGATRQLYGVHEFHLLASWLDLDEIGGQTPRFLLGLRQSGCIQAGFLASQLAGGYVNDWRASAGVHGEKV